MNYENKFYFDVYYNILEILILYDTLFYIIFFNNTFQLMYVNMFKL